VILDTLDVDVAEFERRTGWSLKPQGACKAEMCVPLFQEVGPGGWVDAHVLSQRLAMPLVNDEKHGIWALGPDTVGGRALAEAQAPDLRLPDWRGEEFRLSSLRGLKVFLLAWASW
jgi:hypothetical protein